MESTLHPLRKMAGILACAGAALISQPSAAQAPQSIQSFRSSYNALMDSFDQVFRQEGDARGQQMVEKARSAMQSVRDHELARIFAKSGAPDVAPAVESMRRSAELSQQAIKLRGAQKSLPFPGAPTVIDACNNTPHGDQITYDALIAYQVTSGILAAAAWVCNEDILGENGSAACIPLAIANDIASSFFAVRNFCAGLDTAAQVAGNYTRLDHIHTDLVNAQSAIISNDNANTTTLTNNINASTASIINNSNANTATIIANANTNRDMIVSELRALGCEIVRLLNTPEGLRASQILACSAQPGFPYAWNKH
jgi:hypothetical protein